MAESFPSTGPDLPSPTLSARLRELAAYVSARDIALLVCPRMGHMHNFAGTRAMLWNRLDAFVAQVEVCAS